MATQNSPGDSRVDRYGVDWNVMRVEAGVLDIVDWPNPGDWPGRVIKRQHRSHTNRVGWRWFPYKRLADGSFDEVPSWGHPTAKRAAQALITHLREQGNSCAVCGQREQLVGIQDGWYCPAHIGDGMAAKVGGPLSMIRSSMERAGIFTPTHSAPFTGVDQ